MNISTAGGIAFPETVAVSLPKRDNQPDKSIFWSSQLKQQQARITAKSNIF
ncbi:hypothetical protein JYQ62_32460 [Nostoc sp. UHCC 0702]|nr:hypothetical protein JYQ62_32460 [Nostoc sp. UHCC 0702]